MTGFVFRGDAVLTATGRSFPPTRCAFALPEAESPIIPLDGSLRLPAYVVESPNAAQADAAVIPFESGTRPTSARSVNGANFGGRLAGICVSM